MIFFVYFMYYYTCALLSKQNDAFEHLKMQEQLEPLASLLDMIEKLPVLEFLYLYDDDLPRSSGHDAVRVLGEKMVNLWCFGL